MNDPLRLAAMRATRTTLTPHDRDALAALKAAAEHAGRRVVDTRGPDGKPELVMGFVLDNPSTSDEPGGPPAPSDGMVLALAACVRACWRDHAEPLYPGKSCTVSEIRAALEPLGVKTVTQALNRLRACGYLAPDSGDEIIRLGPEIALWREADVATLRREYHLLPTEED